MGAAPGGFVGQRLVGGESRTRSHQLRDVERAVPAERRGALSGRPPFIRGFRRREPSHRPS